MTPRVREALRELFSRHAIVRRYLAVVLVDAAGAPLVAAGHGTIDLAVATEYVATSISSGGNGRQNEEYAAGMKADNPFVKFYNGERGYVQCEVTPGLWKSDFQVVEEITRPGAPLVTRARFATEAGKPGVQTA